MPGTLTITDLLRSDDVHVHFVAPSVVDAIPVLLRPALDDHVKPQVRDDIVASVIRRERDTATTCGMLALPHARSEHIHHFIVAVGANGGGVIPDHAEPRIIFAFVSPEEKRDEHLHFLASLARLSQNAELVDRISRASDPDGVIAALRAAGL